MCYPIFITCLLHNQGRIQKGGARGLVLPPRPSLELRVIKLFKSETKSEEYKKIVSLFFPTSFVWRRDKVVLERLLDCMCTCKVSKKPNILNSRLKCCPPSPLEALSPPKNVLRFAYILPSRFISGYALV